MAGHSKWSNIKRKKEKTDGARAKIFTKISREILVAVKEGGPDPLANSRLAALIQKAKSNNVPNDNIERLIKKASGADAAEYTEVCYEGYGPRGVAVIVMAATDNRNRTASDMRHYFDKYGGNLGSVGCVSYLFSDCGTIVVLRDDVDEEALMEAALSVGAEDFIVEDEAFIIKTARENVYTIQSALEESGYAVESAEEEKEPSVWVTLDEAEDVRLMNLLLSHIEDCDDVVEVFHNWV
jgi:YebC/PmpR family DNA-binding regulatory protein